MPEATFDLRRVNRKRPPILLGVPEIAETDDGTFELYLDGPTFPSRNFAEAVARRAARQ